MRNAGNVAEVFEHRLGHASLGEETGTLGRRRRRWMLDGIDGTLVLERRLWAGAQRCASLSLIVTEAGGPFSGDRGRSRPVTGTTGFSCGGTVHRVACEVQAAAGRGEAGK
jgi:hypothetical protein